MIFCITPPFFLHNNLSSNLAEWMTDVKSVLLTEWMTDVKSLSVLLCVRMIWCWVSLVQVQPYHKTRLAFLKNGSRRTWKRISSLLEASPACQVKQMKILCEHKKYSQIFKVFNQIKANVKEYKVQYNCILQRSEGLSCRKLSKVVLCRSRAHNWNQ